MKLTTFAYPVTAVIDFPTRYQDHPFRQTPVWKVHRGESVIKLSTTKSAKEKYKYTQRDRLFTRKRPYNPKIKATASASSLDYYTAVLTPPMAYSTPMSVSGLMGPDPESERLKSDVQFKKLEESNNGWVLVTIMLILGFAIISGIILCFLNRRKKLDDLRHRLIPVYSFPPEEEEQWGVLLDNEEIQSGPGPASMNIDNFDNRQLQLRNM